MGTYKSKVDFLRQYCKQHDLIRHEQPSDTDPDQPRQSFFSINDREEFLTASMNFIHSPCMIMSAMSGGILNKGGSLRKQYINTVYIVTKLELDPENPIEARAKDEAYDLTLGIVEDLVAVMEEQYEDLCGASFEPGDCSWEQTDLGDGFYGWEVIFTDEKYAKLSSSKTIEFD